MAKSQWNEVATAAANRRGLATPDNNPIQSISWGRGYYLIEMVASSSLQKIMAAKSTEATLALGWAVDPINQVTCYLYAVCKGVSMDDVGTAMGVLAYNCGNAQIVPLTAPSGTHAEMRIIGSFCETYGVAKSSLRTWKMQIVCIGKKVCQDCGGFLNKYGIPNMSVLPPGKSAAKEAPWTTSMEYGNPSQMWRHPTSGAVFGGGKNLNYYNKNLKSIYKN